MKNINQLLFAMFVNKQLRIFKLCKKQARNEAAKCKYVKLCIRKMLRIWRRGGTITIHIRLMDSRNQQKTNKQDTSLKAEQLQIINEIGSILFEQKKGRRSLRSFIKTFNTCYLQMEILANEELRIF